MNNDLISREDLKKSIEEYRNLNCVSTSTIIGVRNVIYLIDNAPTVEPFEPDYVGAERLKARQRGYEEGYHYGMEIGKTLNPKIKQGEWIIDQNEKFYHYKCPFCGFWATGDFLCTNGNLDLPNFCEKCGADMRGKEE